MFPVAAQEASLPGNMIAGFLLGGLLLYGVGYAMAVMRRANADYKATKAAVPKLRKNYWVQWWTMVKAAFWAALAIACLLTWLIYRNP